MNMTMNNSQIDSCLVFKGVDRATGKCCCDPTTKYTDSFPYREIDIGREGDNDRVNLAQSIMHSKRQG